MPPSPGHNHRPRPAQHCESLHWHGPPIHALCHQAWRVVGRRRPRAHDHALLPISHSHCGRLQFPARWCTTHIPRQVVACMMCIYVRVHIVPMQARSTSEGDLALQPPPAGLGEHVGGKQGKVVVTIFAMMELFGAACILLLVSWQQIALLLPKDGKTPQCCFKARDPLLRPYPPHIPA